MPKQNEPTCFIELEIKILKLAQGDLPQTLTPYASIAEALGCEEDYVLQLLQKLAKTGVIRRFGAILQHRQAGFTHNGLLAWDVNGLNTQQIDALGQALAAHPQISHCYLRTPALLNTPFKINSKQNPATSLSPSLNPSLKPNWAYQLFSMLHANSADDFCKAESEIYQQVKTIVANLAPPLCLKSLRELKKTSMKYF